MNIRSFPVAAMGCVFLLLSTAAGAWSVTYDWDNQSVGQRCDPFNSTTKSNFVTNDNSSSGSKSCKMSIQQGEYGWGGDVSFPSPLKKGDEVWVRFRIFMPVGFNTNIIDTTQGDSNKFVRFDVKDTANTSSYLDLKLENDYKSVAYLVGIQRCQLGDCSSHFGSANDRPARGAWETYEIYMKVDNLPASGGGQGRMRVWKNGVLLADMARNIINNPSDTIKKTLFFSYWNGGSPQTQHLYFDDFVTTNVRPSASDSQGNPYIGVGNFVAHAPPMPPSSIQ